VQSKVVQEIIRGSGVIAPLILKPTRVGDEEETNKQKWLEIEKKTGKRRKEEKRERRQEM
jgi:hypothetical protein